MAGEGQEFYSEADVQEILRRAASLQAPGSLTREDLLRSAQELGISLDALERAESEYRMQKRQAEELDGFRKQQKQGFYSHLVPYVLVNVMLVVINLVTSPEHFWFIYPLLGWGIGLFFHGYYTFNENTEEWQKEFREWRDKRHWRPSYSPFETDVRSVLERELIKARESNVDASKIELIKVVREQTGLDLKDSKDAVEQYLRQNPGAPVS